MPSPALIIRQKVRDELELCSHISGDAALSPTASMAPLW